MSGALPLLEEVTLRRVPSGSPQENQKPKKEREGSRSTLEWRVLQCLDGVGISSGGACLLSASSLLRLPFVPVLLVEGGPGVVPTRGLTRLTRARMRGIGDTIACGHPGCSWLDQGGAIDLASSASACSRWPCRFGVFFSLPFFR